MARIQAVIRRVEPNHATKMKTLSFGGGQLKINFETNEVMAHNQQVMLTSTEFKLLEVLTAQPGKVFARGQLSYKVQGYLFSGEGRSIDAHVKNLRKKIERDSRNPHFIATIIGTGYKFMVHPDEGTA